jgi:hypothetical protein
LRETEDKGADGPRWSIGKRRPADEEETVAGEDVSASIPKVAFKHKHTESAITMVTPPVAPKTFNNPYDRALIAPFEDDYPGDNNNNYHDADGDGDDELSRASSKRSSFDGGNQYGAPARPSNKRAPPSSSLTHSAAHEGPTLPANRLSIRKRLRGRPTGRNGYHRPPVFGPERVVEDPRIQAYHKQVYDDIIRVALITFALTVLVVLLMPSYKGGW